MNTIICIYIIVITMSAALGESEFAIEGRIVGGGQIDITDAPYQVAIAYFVKNGVFSVQCGGSLISRGLVLTAAHCLYPSAWGVTPKPGKETWDKLTIKPSTIRVYGGTTYLSALGPYSNVKSIKTHPDYKHFLNNNMRYHATWNDVGILELETPFDLSDSINIIELRDKPVYENTECIITGWGDIAMGGPRSDALKRGTITIRNRAKCENLHQRLTHRPLHHGTFCAGVESGTTDVCQGDSGGPLVCEGVLTGIVSYGQGCGKISHAGFYTEVYQYVDWISLPPPSTTPTPSTTSSTLTGSSKSTTTSISTIDVVSYTLVILALYHLFILFICFFIRRYKKRH